MWLDARMRVCSGANERATVDEAEGKEDVYEGKERVLENRERVPGTDAGESGGGKTESEGECDSECEYDSFTTECDSELGVLVLFFLMTVCDVGTEE